MSEKISALVVRAKAELVAETKDEMVGEIKIRLRELYAAKKTLDMLELSYKQRLIEMAVDLNEVEAIGHD